jgi:hypothetical protein
MAPWARIEPSLNELMREPIIRAVMARDAVAETDLRRLLDEKRATYAGEECRCFAH